MKTLSQNPAQTEEEARLLALFDTLNIQTRTVYHPPAFTVEDSIALRGDLPGGHCKTLFLRSKKRDYVLIVMDEDGRLDVNTLSKDLSLGRLSFASEEELINLLGVRPGSVTPFALINWPQEMTLTLILDTQMMEKRPLHYHPLHNCATTAIEPEDLLRFIAHLNHHPMIRDLPLR